MNGKATVEWLKKNWLIVVLGVVALAALPTSWFFAQGMNTSVLDTFGKAVQSDYNSVTATNAKVQYAVPTVSGGKTLEKNDYVNQAMIDRYGEIWGQVQGKTGAVSEKGLKFNQNDHKLLIEGLFPNPPELESQVKRREFTKAYIEFHPRILAETRAGAPPAVESVVQQLNDYQQSVVDRIKAESGRDPDAKEQEVLKKELQDMRIARYRARAAEIGYYADPAVFDGVPGDVPNVAPTIAKCWDWQERAWIHHDLVRAVARANGESGAGIPESVVKRVVKFSVDRVAWDPGEGRAAPTASAFDPGEDKAPVDFSRSITGRVSGAGSKNKWYDLRTATLDVVISSKRIPAFIDALAATNFISVLDVDLDKSEIFDDLKFGFYYGDEHVVRATFKLEFVLMRAWRADSMPDPVKAALGMMENADGGDGGGASAPAANPRPRPPAGGGAAPAGGRGGRARDDG